MIALCQLTRLFATFERHSPDGSIVTFLLLVNRHAHKRHSRSVRRDLRISNPDEIEQIFFRDIALLTERSAGCCDKSDQNDEARMTNDE